MEVRGRFVPAFDREEWTSSRTTADRFTLSGDGFVCGQLTGSVIAEYEGWELMDAARR
jgi:hypothetical protein